MGVRILLSTHVTDAAGGGNPVAIAAGLLRYDSDEEFLRVTGLARNQDPVTISGFLQTYKESLGSEGHPAIPWWAIPHIEDAFAKRLKEASGVQDGDTATVRAGAGSPHRDVIVRPKKPPMRREYRGRRH